ncbi:hypothetical protein M9X92_011883 [Pyricularia oryzae]|nr:hypothetical protein M9X92_011883 [Pyricularia oryzae]
MGHVENGIYLDPVRFVRLEKKCGQVCFVDRMDLIEGNPAHNQCGLDFEPVRGHGARCSGTGL